MSNKFITAKELYRQFKSRETIAPDWCGNSTVLLHGPREADKTKKAVDLASAAVLNNRKLLYVDTHHTLDALLDTVADIPRFYVFRPAYDSPDDNRDYADIVISGIEEAVRTNDIKTIIVDSITRIAALSFGRNASPAYIMKRLVALQVRCGLNLLVISHDSTRAIDRALISFADSTIALEAPAPKRQSVGVTTAKAQAMSAPVTKLSDLTSPTGTEPPVPINEDLTVHRAFLRF